MSAGGITSAMTSLGDVASSSPGPRSREPLYSLPCHILWDRMSALELAVVDGGAPAPQRLHIRRLARADGEDRIDTPWAM